MKFTLTEMLPADVEDALLVGRVWVPGTGPCVVTVHHEKVYDLTPLASTMSHLLELPGIVGQVKNRGEANCLGSLSSFLNSAAPETPHLLAPCDLQAVKACGVTFVASLLERVIEEQAKGDPALAKGIRREMSAIIGDDLSQVKPGSEKAMKVKNALIAKGVWSQYLEVGIGPDAEVFTKSQPMSAVGCGAEIGIHPQSNWNNPEPEVVLAVNSSGDIVGATLGNDVNLRDFEGRSALLLGRAKDNNGSTALGPFIRLLDDDFTLDHVRKLDLHMKVIGTDGYVLEDSSSMTMISRDPIDLVGQTINRNHQYPDGFVLFTGTHFAPTQDRFAPGMGFSHEVGDIVSIASPRLGTLINQVNLSTEIAPWTFGTGKLMRNLAKRHLIVAS